MPTGHLPSPTWFRLAIVAIAVVVLCSCRADGPAYRVADGLEDSSVAATFDRMRVNPSAALGPAEGPQPAAAVAEDRPRNDPQVQLAAAQQEVPSYLTDAQVAQATAIPEGCPITPCGPDGCPCGAGGPIRGPSDEYLCDGGDVGHPAAVIRSGEVAGLEPEDAVAHYDTVDGRTMITPSNKVCIYAPRFGAVRQVVDLRALARYDAAEGAILDLAPVRIDEEEEATTTLAGIEPNIHRVQDPPSLLRERQQAGELDRDRRVAVTLGTLAPYANVQVVRTGEIVGTDVVKIARASLAAITWTGDQAAQVLLDSRKAQAEVSVQTPGTIYLLVEPNNPRLRLIKLASKHEAHPGEEVEFTLRFDNVGDRVIGNVVIIDSLTTRLAYVEDSQKSSLEADFTTQANEGDSLVLRWEIQGPLKPGEGGAIQFRTRVR